MDSIHTPCQRRKLFGAWALTALWGAGLLFLAFLPGHLTAQSLTMAGEWLCRFLSYFLTSMSDGLRNTLMRATPVLLQMGAYALLALLLWCALRCSGLGERSALALALAGSTLFTVTGELLQLLPPGRSPAFTDWLFGFLGVIGAIAVIALFRAGLRRFPRVLNRETISYVIFGVLTTIVNILVYVFFYNVLDIHNLISNAVAWVAGMLFAYVVNKLFVFQSKTHTFRAALREFLLFAGARLLSFGVDELGMFLLVDVAGFNGGVCKILMNVIVMVMNYFFSKWFIFKSDSAPSEGNEP